MVTSRVGRGGGNGTARSAVDISFSTADRASASASAEAKRFSGFFSRHLRTAAFKAGGVWAFRLRGGSGAAIFCLTATLSGVSP
jgi:hypothetical protein